METRSTAAIGLNVAMVIMLLVSLVGCQPSSNSASLQKTEAIPSSGNVQQQQPDGPTSSQDIVQQPSDDPLLSSPVQAAAFAQYKEVPVTLKPSIKAYRAAADLDNITNRDTLKLSPQAKDLLSKNGFVVVPSQYREFFSSYEENRYASIPNFVTTDAMLHNYHLYFSHLLRILEKDQLRSELCTLTGQMLTKSQKQYQALQGTGWENAAKRNVAFFTVAARLLELETDVPSYVRKEVDDEVQLIGNHQEVSVPSPVINIGNPGVSLVEALKEDYTQYIPRGHYAKSKELMSYFQAMMWYGRMTFRAAKEDETKSAALMTLLLGHRQEYNHWNRIYEPTNFFVGKSDDLGFNQYYELIKASYGEIPTLDKLTGDTGSWSAFLAGLEKLEPPAINSIPIFDKSIQPDRTKEIKGFRFMGQRFTLDASIFQRLVYREVEANNSGQRRMLPKGLDIPAAMGSKEAYTLLDAMGETGYENYPENMRKMQKSIASLDATKWTQNLYWSWLYTLAPLTEPKGEGYPSFMGSQAWTRKQLESYLGSWTELKHDTILYAKQVYAEMGGGMLTVDDRGYVEPNAVVYARLAALTRMTIEGLNSRDLLNERDRASLERMEELALKLKNIAEKELAGQPLDDQEYDLIRSFGGQLEHFWLEALRDEGVDHPSALAENPAALIADVATNPNDGQVLEEGTGFISNIYAVVPLDGKLRIAKGAVYSYYEFPWPAQDRLTDQKWKEMLESGETPDPPSWAQIYTVPAW